MREIKFEFMYSDGNIFVKATATFEELCNNNAPNDYMYEKALDEQYEDYNGIENFDVVCKRQYTGLKDKNGKEIYEGDIVSLADCEPSLYKIVWWENNFKYGVEYIGNDKTNWQEESLEEFSSELIKVVGNIYENKKE